MTATTMPPVPTGIAQAWSEGRAGEIISPASAFTCLLDEQPSYLVPARLMEALAAQEPPGPLIVNPTCWFSRHGPAPSEIAACLPLPEDFAPSANMVWVGDAATRSLAPFWLGPGLSALLADAYPGASVSAALPPRLRSLLTSARVLVEPDAAAKRRREWTEISAECGRRFQKGYTPLGGLLHPFHLGALRRYCRYLIRTGRLRLGDRQSSRRYAAHNESVTRFFHQQLTGIVGDIVGKPVKPSYVYLASYQSGAELPKHTDREQCEYSITLCIDSSPEPVCESPWPLHLDTGEGTVTVYQALGDALLYRGRFLPHYRTKLPEGFTSTSIFFHYVDADFDGPLR